MEHKQRIVISASRRTDIPAFYMDWFMAGIRQGHFTVENPYSKAAVRVPADPETVHSIVFWSKNFSPFLDGGHGEFLVNAGYHLFFQFTINSESRLLEPHVPPLSRRLDQLAGLARRHNPRAITWRFDPICFYTARGKPSNNLGDLERIADSAAALRIPRCTTSFVDIYRKIDRRCASMDDFSFQRPSREKQVEILLRMERLLAPRGISLHICCEKELAGLLPRDCSISQGACIDHGLLESLFGPGLSGKKDRGQRVSQGCGCMESRDIGSYNLHPCWHNCLFCYANPQKKPHLA